MESTGCKVYLLRAKRPFIAGGHQEEKRYLPEKWHYQRILQARADQEEFGDEDDDDYMVLNVEGGNNEATPYFMKGFINGNRFETMIDTGSPVTIFALDEIDRILKGKNCQCDR